MSAEQSLEPPRPEGPERGNTGTTVRMADSHLSAADASSTENSLHPPRSDTPERPLTGTTARMATNRLSVVTSALDGVSLDAGSLDDGSLEDGSFETRPDAPPRQLSGTTARMADAYISPASATTMEHFLHPFRSIEQVVGSAKVWTTLITNTAYLPGLLTLDFSLKECGSKYPLVALYTDEFPNEGHKALDARGISKKRVEYLLPTTEKSFDETDSRFYDCWSKLTPFSLTEYERVVQLDSDMLVLKNMDELMDIPLDGPEAEGKGDKVFAASHACVCNPLKKPHYPKEWVSANCAFTTQHSDPEKAQTEGASPLAGLAMPNGGLQVVVPSKAVYNTILAALASPDTSSYDFSDQSLLSDLFPGRWVALPYVYNALKTMRWAGVHDAFWQDSAVKNLHYLLSPKPWQESEEVRKGGRDAKTEINTWWWDVNERRQEEERAKGIEDQW
ncbi:hypothetical protein LTR08_004507 [Meristemomyces frigidus]|nr:hypothetical protein LTR08_004507 [Meristemomyces frigidus]